MGCLELIFKEIWITTFDRSGPKAWGLFGEKDPRPSGLIVVSVHNHASRPIRVIWSKYYLPNHFENELNQHCYNCYNVVSDDSAGFVRIALISVKH